MTERLAYSIAEAAEAIGISQDTFYKLIQRGKVHSVLVGKRRLIPRASLLELLGVATEEAEGRIIENNSVAFSLAASATLLPLVPPDKRRQLSSSLLDEHVAESKSAHDQEIVVVSITRN